MVKWTWSGQKPVNVSERSLEAVFGASSIYVAKSISISRGGFFVQSFCDFHTDLGFGDPIWLYSFHLRRLPSILGRL